MTDNDLKQKASRLKNRIRLQFAEDFIGLFREFRWSCLPPLMVYFAAGISGFTGIIESFFENAFSHLRLQFNKLHL